MVVIEDDWGALAEFEVNFNIFARFAPVAEIIDLECRLKLSVLMVKRTMRAVGKLSQIAVFYFALQFYTKWTRSDAVSKKWLQFNTPGRY